MRQLSPSAQSQYLIDDDPYLQHAKTMPIDMFFFTCTYIRYACPCTSNIALPLPACQLCMHESTNVKQLRANPWMLSRVEKKGEGSQYRSLIQLATPMDLLLFPCQRPIFLLDRCV
jgi:hypothetical protein